VAVWEKEMNASSLSRLDQVFDHIVVINLPSRADRRQQMDKELARVGVPAHVVYFFPAIRPEEDGGFPSTGARGAYLSHLAVLRQARNEGWHSVLVMEDDLQLHPRLPHVWPALAGALAQHHWGLAYLGHMGSDPVHAPPSGDTPYWQPTHLPQQCLHCYAVHERVFDDVIAYLEACLHRPAGHPDGGLMHVDGAMSMFRQRHPEVLTLLAQPSLGSQRPSRSDITHNRWYDRWPLTRALVDLARQLKNGWQRR
jgi:hypothetical protein